jgi:RNA polymerase sigma-70 factor (ECF subfamily)
MEIYSPLIYSFLRKRGLQDADAADVAQDALNAVARAVKSLDYDPHHGSFRAWLFTVVRSKLSNFAKRRRPDLGVGDTTAQKRLEEQPDQKADIATQWDRDYEQRMLAWACDQVRGEVQTTTWEAFRLTALEGKVAQEVAQSLGISVAAAYLAKSRFMVRVKNLVRQLQLE